MLTEASFGQHWTQLPKCVCVRERESALALSQSQLLVSCITVTFCFLMLLLLEEEKRKYCSLLVLLVLHLLNSFRLIWKQIHLERCCCLYVMADCYFQQLKTRAWREGSSSTARHRHCCDCNPFEIYSCCWLVRKQVLRFLCMHYTSQSKKCVCSIQNCVKYVQNQQTKELMSAQKTADKWQRSVSVTHTWHANKYNLQGIWTHPRYSVIPDETTVIRNQM